MSVATLTANGPRPCKISRRRRKMGVKKNDQAQRSRLNPNLESLQQYLTQLNDQAPYLPPQEEILNVCENIIKNLSNATEDEEVLSGFLHTVENFLMRVTSNVSSEARHEIVTLIIDKFHGVISDPQSKACPATAAVLVVIDSSDNESSRCVARWLVQQRSSPSDSAGLRCALSCLYNWVVQRSATLHLGEWLKSYIKALEENKRLDVLIDVSLDHLSLMFLALDSPILKPANFDVLFYILASLRENIVALDKLSPHIPRVLTNLAVESGHWSRELLQNSVDILSATIDGFLGSLEGDALEAFRMQYADVITCLEQHMASGGCAYLAQASWKQIVVCPSSSIVPVTETKLSGAKAGLVNLGNTCYVNSVLQALLLTRQFSRYVLMKMTGVPYWAKMGHLFAKMMFSIVDSLNPTDFFNVFRPPFFTLNNQHDSFEFLGYLFELLVSYENCSEKGHDYTRLPVLMSANRHRHTSQNNNEMDNDGASQSRRSSSPRPGSSSGSSSGNKRFSPENEHSVPPKKRMRKAEVERLFQRRDTIIDTMFGGVILTRLQCIVCGSCSQSRDVFWDLQLSFPEKSESLQYSVQGLLELYCTKERLTGENRYHCRDCGVLRDAERSVLIEATPKYLILVLKNFKFDTNAHAQRKLMHTVFHNYMINLPADRSQAGFTKYTLYATVIHTGTSLDSGHYFTLGKDHDHVWRLYNDEEVFVADEAEVNRMGRSSTPYILFYQRCDVDEAAPLTVEQLPPELVEVVLAHNKYCVDKYRDQQLTCP